MPLRVYNTLTQTKEPFVTVDPAGKKVGMYVCGPTFRPINPAHGKNTAVKPSSRSSGTAFVHGLSRPSSKVITNGCGGSGSP